MKRKRPLLERLEELSESTPLPTDTARDVLLEAIATIERLQDQRRDRFAAAALQAITSGLAPIDGSIRGKERAAGYAEAARMLADALIAELEGSDKP